MHEIQTIAIKTFLAAIQDNNLHISSENINAFFGALTKNDLLQLLEQEPNALNAISNELSDLPINQLLAILQNSYVLRNIAVAAYCGNPNALNAISSALAGLSAQNLLPIFKKSPSTLSWLATAAIKGHLAALNAISNALIDLPIYQLMDIKNAPDTLPKLAGAVFCASYYGDSDALDAISKRLEFPEELPLIFQNKHTLDLVLDVVYEYDSEPNHFIYIGEALSDLPLDQLMDILTNSPRTLDIIAIRKPYKLNSISNALSDLSTDQLLSILQNSDALSSLAKAAYGYGNDRTQYPNALNAISNELGKFSEKDLLPILQGVSYTVDNIAFAACTGHPNALNAISNELGKFSGEGLLSILENAPQTLAAIAIAEVNGHTKAYTAIRSILGEEDNFKTITKWMLNDVSTLPYIVLPTNIQIDEQAFTECPKLQIVVVPDKFDEEKKEDPNYFKKRGLSTKEIISYDQITQWAKKEKLSVSKKEDNLHQLAFLYHLVQHTNSSPNAIKEICKLSVADLLEIKRLNPNVQIPGRLLISDTTHRDSVVPEANNSLSYVLKYVLKTAKRLKLCDYLTLEDFWNVTTISKTDLASISKTIYPHLSSEILPQHLGQTKRAAELDPSEDTSSPSQRGKI